MPFRQYRCRDVPEYMKDVEFNKWSAFIESLYGAHGEDALFRSRSSHWYELGQTVVANLS